MFYAAAPFFAGAKRLLAARRLGMDVPVALAVALIYAGSVVEVVAGGPDVWFESVSMFVFFLSVGRYLEMRARHRAGDLSDALARLSPVFADRIEADGSLVRVGAIELVPGDRVIVADGAGVPADGVLESAQCRVDEALLCGESAPLTRRRGDTLCAGSVVIGNPATVRVTRVGADTVVAGIVALTARAATTKPRLARAGERAAAGFIARVLVLAACTAIGWAIVDPGRAFSATVAVLVVACPCAFALAAPAAVTRTLAVLAGRGVLVVRPDALEDLAAATHVMFDKTGTLTEPSIARDRTVMLRDIDRDAALALAAALAQGSRHPLARAFAAAAPAALPVGRRARKCRGLVESAASSTDAAIASVGRTTHWPRDAQRVRPRRRRDPRRRRWRQSPHFTSTSDCSRARAPRSMPSLATASRSRSQVVTRRRRSHRWPQRWASRPGLRARHPRTSSRGSRRFARMARASSSSATA